MTVPPYAVAYVVTVAASWSADHFNRFVLSNSIKDLVTNFPSRGLHSAIFAFIGAMGFLASAVLPPDAYLVSPADLNRTNRKH